MPVSSKSASYLKNLLNPVREAIVEVGAKSAVDTLMWAVSITIVDSGRAANNWHIGDGSVAFDWAQGTPPVGQSGSTFENRASNMAAVIDSKMVEAAVFESTYRGGDFRIYNPMEPGDYEYNALSQVDFTSKSSENAFLVGEMHVREKYPGLFI